MSRLKNTMKRIKYGLAISLQASRKYFILYSVIIIISAIIPYIPLYFWKMLLNYIAMLNYDTFGNIIAFIITAASFYCLAMILERLCEYVSSLILYKYYDILDYYFDNLLIDKMLNVDMAFFDSSDLNDKMNYSWIMLQYIKSTHRVVFQIIQSFITMIISCLLLTSLSIWFLPIVVILCIPHIFGDRISRKMDTLLEMTHMTTNRKLDYYKGLFFGNNQFEIRLYRLKLFFIEKYELEWKKKYAKKKKNEVKKSIIAVISSVIMTINDLLVYIISINKLIAKEIGVGDVSYYITLVKNFRRDFILTGILINDLDMFSSMLEYAFEFIQMKPLVEKSGNLIPNMQPKIEFRDVWFKYPNASEYVLKNCTFTIEPGEIVGLVGLNGSGKSTIVKLLLRFYDPEKGEILFDGINSKEYDIVKLRNLFGVVFQDYMKYSLTAKENIMLSNIETYNEALLNKACMESEVEEIINKWENGLDENLTRLFDPSGKELSGGEWQRIAIARAFYKDAKMVILDEPSAALDPIAEHNIFIKFKKLAEKKSTLLISHRLSSITLADKILVLEDGHIIEQGTHEDLLLRKGKYAHLFNLQASKYTEVC